MKFNLVKQISDMPIEKIKKEIKTRTLISNIIMALSVGLIVTGFASAFITNPVEALLVLPVFVGSGVIYLFFSLIFDLQVQDFKVELRLRELENKNRVN